MEARQAYRMIQWYDVYLKDRSYEKDLSDLNEDRFIYLGLLDILKDCHDVIDSCSYTYHWYYEFRKK